MGNYPVKFSRLHTTTTTCVLTTKKYVVFSCSSPPEQMQDNGGRGRKGPGKLIPAASLQMLYASSIMT